MVLKGRAGLGLQGPPPDPGLGVEGRHGQVGAGGGAQGPQDSPCLGTKSILTSAREGRADGTRTQAGPGDKDPTPTRRLTHEVELGRQIAGEALGHKAVVSLVRGRDVVNGQFVDPAGQR